MLLPCQGMGRRRQRFSPKVLHSGWAAALQQALPCRCVPKRLRAYSRGRAVLGDARHQLPLIPDLRDSQELQQLSLSVVRHHSLLFLVSHQETAGARRQKFFPTHRIIQFCFQSCSIAHGSRAFTLTLQGFLETISFLGTLLVS